MVWKTGRTMAAAAIAVAVATLAGQAEAGQIRLGMTTWVGYGPLFLARDKGFFKANGVDVDLQIIEDSSLYMAAVASGNLDGAAATVDELMKYRSSDLCFKYVLALDDSHGGDGILVQPDVTSLQGIKGKEVGLNEGSVSEFWFNILLKQAGMSEQDVTVTNMTADDAATAFIAGRIPVAVTWEPHLTAARQQQKGKVLVDSSTTPGAIVDVVALNCDLITKSPKDVEGLVKGYYQAIEFIKANPQEAYAVMAKGVGGYLAKPEEFAAAAQGVHYYDRARNIEFFGTADKGQAADLIKLANDIWGGFGKLKQAADYAGLVDTGFITAQ